MAGVAIAFLKPIEVLAQANNINFFNGNEQVFISDFVLAEIAKRPELVGNPELQFTLARSILIKTGVPEIASDLKALGVDPELESSRRMVEQLENMDMGTWKISLLAPERYRHFGAQLTKIKTIGVAHLTNLLEETMKAIYTSGHTLGDIAFIGSPETGHRCTWPEFEAMANFEYDEGYGLQLVARDLVILFTDDSRLVRTDYDGSEAWKLVEPFYISYLVHPIKTLARSEGDKHFYAATLAELNKESDNETVC